MAILQLHRLCNVSEFKRMWEEAVVDYFKKSPNIFLHKLKKSAKYLGFRVELRNQNLPNMNE
jgi:hypothetical protein